MSNKLGLVTFSVVTFLIVVLYAQIWVTGPVYSNPSRMQGVVYLGFESRFFKPCGSEESWWIAIDESSFINRLFYEFNEKTKGTRKNGVFEIYLDADINISNRGRFGHLGMSDREVEIIQIHEIIDTKSKGCLNNES
ncbi:hypothetical protein [Alteromonas sp. BMJM2]|uniref:hypothetical protein n=1 Tax=Alteromonas sp. BMJM2 TaxID=2954241 RepID=UPI0022B3AACF|nr:hypothetical protein [Alteromonas sp. BMJM2]